jgi:hypothetical protein
MTRVYRIDFEMTDYGRRPGQLLGRRWDRATIHLGLQCKARGYQMLETAARGDLMTSNDVGRKPEFPCHVCGGSVYTWGGLGANGINFTPDDASFLAKFFRFGGTLPARRCDNCGNIQIFARIPAVDE